MKTWNTGRAAKIAAVMGIITTPIDVMLHPEMLSDDPSYWIARLIGWAMGIVFFTALVCAAHNIFVSILRKLTGRSA